MAILTTKLDGAFSKCIRLRANWTCEFPGCGKFFPEGETGGLDCSHVEGRRSRSVRWFPDNAFAMCKYHHRFLGENPLLHSELALRALGVKRFSELKEMAHSPRKFTPRELEGLYQFYLAELKRMRLARENGRLGRIEFEFPNPIPEAAPRKKAKKKEPSKFKRKLDGTVVERAA